MKYIVFVLFVIGIAIEIFAVMPLFCGKHVVTNESLKLIEEAKLPLEIRKQIEGQLSGKQFVWGFQLQSRLFEVLGEAKAKEYGPIVLSATGTMLSMWEIVGACLACLLGFGLCIFAFFLPME
ncbi:MAG: hypothetical protein KKD47_04810 [Proteobacteria bacterium]|nr:hypothetical protein [Pseudomonadota bacterium]